MDINGGDMIRSKCVLSAVLLILAASAVLSAQAPQVVAVLDGRFHHAGGHGDAWWGLRRRRVEKCHRERPRPGSAPAHRRSSPRDYCPRKWPFPFGIQAV